MATTVRSIVTKMARMTVLNLPDDSVRAICEFVRVESTPYKNEKNIQTDIRALLDSCTRLRELKLSEVGMWRFTCKHAE